MSLVEELSQPLVVTLHTVLSEPTPHQASVLAAVCRQAELVIVMTDTARDLLVEGGTCPFEKVRVVPHGAPPVLARRASELAIKRALGEPTGPAGSSGRLDDRFLLSTFGLISEARASRP